MTPISSTSTKASAPSPVGTVITPSMGFKNFSLKFSMNQAGRRIECR